MLNNAAAHGPQVRIDKYTLKAPSKQWGGGGNEGVNSAWTQPAWAAV